MPSAQERRRALLELLEQGDAHTQAELLEALAAAGFASTQPVISRDLRAIGAVKSSGGYAMPSEERVTPLETLRSLLRDATLAGPNLCIVVCEPGAANAIARAMEAEGDLPILGSVAGDDTIFVATAKKSDSQLICDRVLALV